MKAIHDLLAWLGFFICPAGLVAVMFDRIWLATALALVTLVILLALAWMDNRRNRA